MSQNVISRKNLVSSLITGVVIGLVAGAALGWIAHQFYTEQRLAQILVCREKNKNQPAAMVDSICGSGL